MKNGIKIPLDFINVLKNEEQVLNFFEKMSPTCQKTYIDWVDEAKRAETRKKRIKKAKEMIIEWGERNIKKNGTNSQNHI